jgi:hypothetical protein
MGCGAKHKHRVRAIKRHGGARNPYAVARAQEKRKRSKRK